MTPQNSRAEICRTVLEGGPILADALLDRIGLPEKQGEALLSNLCREGILRRSPQDRVTVMDRKRCERYAAEAAPPPPAESTMPPVLKLATPPKVRAELALPEKIGVRKGVPLPLLTKGRAAAPCPFPFAEMREVGDSFALDVPVGAEPKLYAKAIHNHVRRYAKSNPDFKVAIRTAPDGSWVGCWREAGEPVKPENVADVTGSLGIRTRKKGNGAAA